MACKCKVTFSISMNYDYDYDYDYDYMKYEEFRVKVKVKVKVKGTGTHEVPCVWPVVNNPKRARGPFSSRISHESSCKLLCSVSPTIFTNWIDVCWRVFWLRGREMHG